MDIIKAATQKTEWVYTLAFIGIILGGISLYTIAPAFTYVLVSVITLLLSWSGFLILWNARNDLEDYYLLYLTIILFVASYFSVVYVFSLASGGTIIAATTNQLTQLHLIAGMLQSILTLWISITAIRWKRVSDSLILLFMGIGLLVLAVVYSSLFVFGIIPTMYIEGQGYTSLYHIASYVVVGAWLSALTVFHFNRIILPGNVRTRIYIFLIGMPLSYLLSYLLNRNGLQIQIVPALLVFVALSVIFRACISLGLNRPIELLLDNYRKQNFVLSEQSERFNAILNNTNQSFILVKPDTEILTFNRAAAELVHHCCRSPLTIGRKLSEMPASETGTNLMRVLTKAIAGENVLDESMVLDRDQRPQWLRLILNPVEEEGQIQTILINLTDITQQKVAQI